MADGGARQLLQRTRPWLGLGAVLLPLAILLALQYRALVKLEETSAVAHRMSLKGYARSILRSAEDFYARKAQALDIAASLFAAGRAAELGSHFAAQDSTGIERFFVIAFGERGGRAPVFYERDGRRLDAAPSSAEARAVQVASAPWRLLARDRTEVDAARAVAGEQDPENRVVLKPILDAGSRVVGVAGFLVDEVFFRREYLPALIEAQSAELPEPLRGHVVATVRDGEGRLLAGSSGTPPSREELAPPFRFVFTDWRLGVGTRHVTPEQWARWSFGINLSLSVFMSAALLAAIVLALRSASRATRLSQMKTEFVSNVSHELRTPLSSIRVFGEFLRLGRASPDKVREYGEYIEAESRRLTRLVDNILDFSRIESGQKSYRFERTDVAEVVGETLKALEVRLRQEGFSLDVRRPGSPVAAVLADPGAIAQAVTNLVDNAVKYSGEARSVGVEIGQSNGWVTVAVSDRGPGIRPEEQERIFEKFYRVSTGLVHDAKGSGLGLAIVKHIVEAHRGSVRVDSRPGAGSTFTIHLPAGTLPASPTPREG
ncbi:MAG: sensor histidine kinase [Candidatus Binatia bacterium]